MACKREDRYRHNTIAFWLSDEEKSQVEVRIILSGVAVIGQVKGTSAYNIGTSRGNV